MSELMFFGEFNQWAEFSPEHLLALRAASPANVFTLTAKSGYLSKTAGDEELMELAFMFTDDDWNFINALTESEKGPMIQLCQLAYRKNIRPANPAVKRM